MLAATSYISRFPCRRLRSHAYADKLSVTVIQFRDDKIILPSAKRFKNRLQS